MLLIIFILIGVSIILVFVGIAGIKRGPRVELPRAENNRAKRPKIFSYLHLIFPLSDFLLDKLGLKVHIKRKLESAHLRLNAAEFFNLKILLIPFLLLAAYMATGKIDLFILLACLAAGYFIPDFILVRRIAKRKAMIIRLLPETIDLLGLCIEAGLDFNTSLKWIIDKIPANPILEEFTFLLEEIQWGKPRNQALKDMSRRLNIPEMSSFVHTLAQSERMGTPVAEVFSMLSEDARRQRFHRGERLALKAPIKILIPLVLCILPVIAIIIAGPILLQFMQGGLIKGFGQ